ncbi:MAG TPA: hypothetical protein VF070_31580, partial [Streptosporangiaceae bacterium]
DVEIKGLVEDWAPVSGTFSSRKLLSFRETEACDARYVTIAGICTAQLGKLSTDESDDMSQTHLIDRRVQSSALSSTGAFSSASSKVVDEPAGRVSCAG